MSWLSRFLNVFRGDRLNRDLDDEIQFHVAARTEELARRAMTPEQAEEQAKRQLGHPLLLRERSRDIKLFPWFESMVQDVQFGLRGLARCLSYPQRYAQPVSIRVRPIWDIHSESAAVR